MSDDWDGDGDEDFTDGVFAGLFWGGPLWLAILVVIVCLLIWWYSTW